MTFVFVGKGFCLKVHLAPKFSKTCICTIKFHLAPSSSTVIEDMSGRSSREQPGCTFKDTTFIQHKPGRKYKFVDNDVKKNCTSPPLG